MMKRCGEIIAILVLASSCVHQQPSNQLFASAFTNSATTTTTHRFTTKNNGKSSTPRRPFAQPSKQAFTNISFQHQPSNSITLQMSSSNPSDNDQQSTSLLINIVSLIGISSAMIMFWSEYSIALTRCGPPALKDIFERSSYITTFVFASSSNLARIIYQCSLTDLMIGSDDNHMNSSTKRVGSEESEILSRKTLFHIAEVMSVSAILGAFVVLGLQMMNGDALSDSAGLSGIDIDWCRLVNEG